MWWLAVRRGDTGFVKGLSVDSAGSAAAAARAKLQGKDYVLSFANAIQRFGADASQEELLAQIPSLLTTHFEASRAELWLWDDSSDSAYLTHTAGVEATHRRDYATPGRGLLGKSAQQMVPIRNAELGSAEAADLVGSGQLTHVSVYPLIANSKLLALVASYSSAPVSDDMLQWWGMYANVASVAVRRALAAEESQKQIQQLSLLFEATRLLNSTLDLAELLELILKIARTEVKADRGTVFLADSKRKELWSIVAQGLDAQEIRVPFGKGVAGHVVESGEIINVADAYTLDFFDRSFDQKFGYRTKSLLCIPIRHKTNEIVGVIQLLNQVPNGHFTNDDEDFLLKLSGHMAMALENARLHRDVLDKQRMERDLAVARNIQQSLLPEKPPVVPGFDIAVTNEPCAECGGDYYDFLSLGPQTLLLVVTDVEGKGVASALVMSNLQATLRALVMHLHSLEVLMLSLNEMIHNDTKRQKYLSCFLGLVDTRRNGLHYINGGHCPPIVVSGDTGDFVKLDKGGTVVGMFPDSVYERGSVQLNKGDILVCCTDGISEACNVNEDEFETEGLAASVAKHRHKSAAQIVEAVLADVNEFAKGGPHIDDKVLMIVKVTGDGQFQQASGKKSN